MTEKYESATVPRGMPMDGQDEKGRGVWDHAMEMADAMRAKGVDILVETWTDRRFRVSTMLGKGTGKTVRHDYEHSTAEHGEW